jgi:hypothetical protein
MGEQTGSRIFYELWSYVLDEAVVRVYGGAIVPS